LSKEISGDALPPQPIGQKQAAQKNYEKPWLKNAKGQEPEKPKDAAKTFLEHHYPDGVGPDTDLINMLERDCL
jgi:katanin p60 ATPase-containing subunit A1